jgi:O-antigen/teichoic acid export membrane protein
MAIRRGFLAEVLRGERPLQAALLTFATQGVVVLLNVLTGVVTARLLGPTGRGVFTAVTIWPQFLSGLAVLGLPSALVFYIRRDPAHRDRLLSAGVLLAVALGAVGTLAGLLLVAGSMTHYGRNDIRLGWFCAAWTVPYVLTVVLRQVMAADGRMRAFNVSSYLPPLLYGVLLAGACLVAPLTPATAALCLMLPSGIVAVWMVFELRSAWQPSLQGLGGAVRRLCGYAAQAAPGDLVTGVLASLDRLVLVAVLAPDIIGLYAVAYSLSRLLLILQTVASAVLFPQMTGRDPAAAKRLHDFAFRLVLYVSVVAVLAAAVLGRSALALVYGPAFGAAAPILVVLVAEAGLASAGQVTCQLFLALHRPGWVSTAQVASLATAAVGLVVLVPRTDAAGGALGAALALLAASTLRLAVLLPGIPWRLRLMPPRLHPTAADFVFVRSRLL